MINLELYRIFYIVAEASNITRASEILNISQPAITKHIKNLEDQLGNPLFIRTKKGVILNEFGEKLFLKVKQALVLIEEAEKEIKVDKAKNNGTIKIGVSTTLTRKYLLKYIDSFHALYPNVIINITNAPTKELIKQLKNGVIDILVCKHPRNLDLDLNYIKLGETKYIFVTNNKYSELLNRRVSVNELVNYPLLLQKEPSNAKDSVSAYFKENNIRIEPKMNIASSNLLVDFLIRGYGIGYVTKLYVNKELENKELYEIKVIPDTETIDYGVMFLKNNILTSHCQKFVQHLNNDKKIDI